MALKIKAGQGDVRLWLQMHRLDPPLGLSLQLQHPPALQEVGHQRRDEHRLARARQAGDAKAQRRVEKGLGQRGPGPFDPARDPVRQSGKRQGCPLLLSGQDRGGASGMVGGGSGGVACTFYRGPQRDQPGGDS